MSTMEPNQGKKDNNPVGAWRLQAATKLNGLIMHDFDKLSKQGLTPQEVYDAIPQHWFDDDARFSVMLAHVTVSGDGLRLVTTADPKLTIEDNQQAVATALSAALGKPLEKDKSVFNADRTSFAVRESDIYYINERIFNYDNPAYHNTFGEEYRRGRTHRSHRNRSTATASVVPLKRRDAESAVQVDGQAAGQLDTYKGVPFQTIVDEWVRQRGTPAQGERHVTMLRLAGDLRYICDNDPERLKLLVRMAQFVRDIEQERGAEEIDDACEDACERKMYMSIPKNFRSVLTAVSCRGAQALGTRASGVAVLRLSSCGFWALEHRFSGCGTWA